MLVIRFTASCTANFYWLTCFIHIKSCQDEYDLKWRCTAEAVFSDHVTAWQTWFEEHSLWFVDCGQDTKTVVGKLELVIGVVLHLIFLFFYLMVFNVSTLLLQAFASVAVTTSALVLLCIQCRSSN